MYNIYIYNILKHACAYEQNIQWRLLIFIMKRRRCHVFSSTYKYFQSNLAYGLKRWRVLRQRCNGRCRVFSIWRWTNEFINEWDYERKPFLSSSSLIIDRYERFLSLDHQTVVAYRLNHRQMFNLDDFISTKKNAILHFGAKTIIDI